MMNLSLALVSADGPRGVHGGFTKALEANYFALYSKPHPMGFTPKAQIGLSMPSILLVMK